MQPTHLIKLNADRSLVLRLVTGFTAGPIILWIIYQGGLPFAVLIGLVSAIATIEFYGIVRYPRAALWIGVPAALVIVAAGYIGTVQAVEAVGVILIALLISGIALCGRQRRSLLMLIAALYVALPLSICVVIRQLPLGIVWTFTIVVTNWGTDSMAYIIGHLFGRHPLARQISPNKSIEGAIGGALSGIAIGVLLNLIAGSLTPTVALIAIGVAPATVAGDLLESAFKRQFGVKDASGIIPGHGGILDRIDGLLAASVVAGVLLLLSRAR